MYVEQNAGAALEFADDTYVLESGRITIEGPGRGLINNPQVAATYLGGAREAPQNGRLPKQA